MALRIDTPSASTRRLLGAGIVAGPVFLGTWLVQALTRDGFEPTRHPVSLLALGEGGWVQIANFVVTGALCVACAEGLRRELGTRWGPRLVAAFGVGLAVAGVFVADAGAGFPAGAPAGAPLMSWHGAVHEVGFLVAQLSWTAAAAVFTRRFAARGQRRAAVATAASLVGALVLAAWPDPASFTVRTAVASAIEFGWLAAVARSTAYSSGRTRSTHEVASS